MQNLTHCVSSFYVLYYSYLVKVGHGIHKSSLFYQRSLASHSKGNFENITMQYFESATQCLFSNFKKNGCSDLLQFLVGEVKS